MQIEQFLCRTDNIALLLHDEKSRKTIAIDAPDGAAIATMLDKKGWGLDVVLITHHHCDHVEGISLLKEKTGALIIGPDAEKEKIPGLDNAVCGKDRIDTGFCQVEAIATPGHTAGALSYYLPEEKLVFTGDTLFSLGCGRLFAGTADMMFSSLQTLGSLPGGTYLYCGHEYTEKNGDFALSVDPDNQALRRRMENVTKLRRQNRLTLPSTIVLEQATNPFLRCSDKEIRKNINRINASDISVFTELRKLKDKF